MTSKWLNRLQAVFLSCYLYSYSSYSLGLFNCVLSFLASHPTHSALQSNIWGKSHMTSTDHITNPRLQYTLTHTHLLSVQKHLWSHTNTNTFQGTWKEFPLGGSTCRRLIELSSIDPPLHLSTVPASTLLQFFCSRIYIFTSLVHSLSLSLILLPLSPPVTRGCAPVTSTDTQDWR